MELDKKSEQIIIAAEQSLQEKQYWLEKLSGELVKTFIPYDFPSKAKERNQRTETIDFSIPGELGNKMLKLSGGSEARLHMILTAGMVLLLGKYTGRDDIIIGTTIDRQDSEGEFINTELPLRNRLDETKSFKELLLQVRTTIVEAIENQNYPIETIINQLDIELEENESLFDVALLLENINEKSYLKHIKPGVIFYFNAGDHKIEGRLDYNGDIYENATMNRFIRYYLQLMETAMANMDGPVSEIDILSEQEKNRVLFELNDTRVPYSENKTLHELFEEQVKKTPQGIAVVDEDREYTYRQLNKRAVDVSRVLVKKGVRPGEIVAIMSGRTFELIAGILGILKTGAAYLPIEPELPVERIIAMLEDSSVSQLLVHSDVLDKYSFSALQGIKLIKTKPTETVKRPQIKDFNSLPIPDRSLVNFEKYSNFIGMALVKHSFTLQATRGCPYKCLYCHKIWPKTHVYRSAESIYDEVKHFYDMGVRRFVFVDDIFNLNEKNSRKFFNMVLKNKLDLQLFFPNGMRGDILTKDYIDLMMEAGTVNLALALETASPRIQKLIKKNLNIERLRENIAYICENYLNVILDLLTMHGFPSETEEEAMMTMNFIKSMKWIHFPYVHILKIYPTTELAQLALRYGVSHEAIAKAENMAYHELPDTLPFEKSFSVKYQADYLNDYFLLKERLVKVLPHQMKLMTEDELVKKYRAYLNIKVNNLDELLQFLNIEKEELWVKECLEEGHMAPPDLGKYMAQHYPKRETRPDAMRVLLMDLSQWFSDDKFQLNDIVEPPLGLMYLMTYLHEQQGDKVNGKVVKSRFDFDSFEELRELLEEFKPDVIGIRTLSLYKDFLHETTAMIRQFGIDVPIFAGGPYGSSEYQRVLQDRNISVVVLGEGEVTLNELIGKMIENGGKLPDDDVLKEIAGIAFIPKETDRRKELGREITIMDELDELDEPEELGEQTEQESMAGSDVSAKPSDVAYVIFTSGSTGKMKGVMVEHQEAVNYIEWAAKKYGNNENGNYPLYTSISFDLTVTSLFAPLVTGKSIVMYNGKNKEQLIDKIIEDNKVGIVKLTPSHLKLMREKEIKETSIKSLIVGGEELETCLTYDIYNKFGGNVNIYNEYGPTEATVGCMIYKYNPETDNRTSVPIGQPIANTRVYILDKDKKPVADGIIGELYIAGDGVARGYLARPDLTKEKFMEDPFVKDGRMYRTGDLARRIHGGDVEFIGRIDDQVKIRGHRIELGEIQTRLESFDPVKEALVLPQADNSGDVRLAAYVVPDSKNAFTVQRLLHMEKEGLLKDNQRYDMPNGMTVFYMNRSEVDFMYNEIFESQLYIKHGITLEEGAVVFDVGANIGLFSLYVNKVCKDAEIYAFEPVPPVYEMMKLNMSLYRIKAKLFDLAISSEEGETPFTFYPHASIVSGRFTDTEEVIQSVRTFIQNQQLSEEGRKNVSAEEMEELLAERLSKESLNCSMKTLSQVIRENNVEKIDLLKVVVEKSEADVLAGIEEKHWGKIQQIVLEVHNVDGRLDELREKIENHGFDTTVKQAEILKDTGLYIIYALRPNIQKKKTPVEESSHRDYNQAWYSPERLTHGIREYLDGRIPDYMIPSYFVLLEKIPLTPNGKVDKKQLPVPDSGTSRRYEAPQNHVEKKLAQVWQEVLGVEKIGINDDFFEIGGDSIKTIQISARLQKHGMKIDISDLFQTLTIKKLAPRVKMIKRKIDQRPVIGEFGLTPVQQWFFEKEFTGGHHFNHAVMLYNEKGFRQDIIEKTFTKIVQHHDALRMVYQFKPGEKLPVQVNRDLNGKYFDIQCFDYTDQQNVEEKIQQEAARIQGTIDIETGPLVKLGLFKTVNGDHLLIVIHHLVVDGVSWRIIFEDFNIGYNRLEKGEELRLQDKTDSFKYWWEKSREYAETKEALSELDYWTALESRKIKPLPRQYQVEPQKKKNKNIESVQIQLDETETAQILKEVHRAYNTNTNDILLSALGLAIKKWDETDALKINLEGHGRETSVDEVEISRTVGWLTAQYPVVMELNGMTDLAASIKSVKETLRNVPSKGFGYGILRYYTPPEMKTGFQVDGEPDIGFNFLGEFGQEKEKDGSNQLIRLSHIHPGDSISPEFERTNALDVNGMVIGGRLSMSFSYNKYEYDRERVRELAEDYKKCLQDIIGHCLGKEEVEMTPSDFTKKDIQTNELDNVMDQVKDLF